MKKDDIMACLFAIFFVIVCVATSFAAANWIATSDLPDWMKFYLLSR